MPFIFGAPMRPLLKLSTEEKASCLPPLHDCLATLYHRACRLGRWAKGYVGVGKRIPLAEMGRQTRLARLQGYIVT